MWAFNLEIFCSVIGLSGWTLFYTQFLCYVGIKGFIKKFCFKLYKKRSTIVVRFTRGRWKYSDLSHPLRKPLVKEGYAMIAQQALCSAWLATLSLEQMIMFYGDPLYETFHQI